MPMPSIPLSFGGPNVSSTGPADGGGFSSFGTINFRGSESQNYVTLGIVAVAVLLAVVAYKK